MSVDAKAIARRDGSLGTKANNINKGAENRPLAFGEASQPVDFGQAWRGPARPGPTLIKMFAGDAAVDDSHSAWAPSHWPLVNGLRPWNPGVSEAYVGLHSIDLSVRIADDCHKS